MSAPSAGYDTEPGVVEQVVYVGAVTRYGVQLDAGGALTVVSQNVESFSARAEDERGRRVVLAWRPENTFTIVESDKEVAE